MFRKVDLFGVALATAIGACVAMSGPLLAADAVVMRLSYTPFAAHIPIYVAAAKGFYRDAGLVVDIRPGRGSTFAAMTVGAAKEEFGVSDPTAVLAARAKGVPVVAVANLQQDNGVAFIATDKSGITKAADLKGRKVGILPGSTTTIFLQALMRKYGVALEDTASVTWRPGTDLPMLLDGSIEAEATVYNNEVITWAVEHPELKLKVWTMASLGFDTPGYAIITSEELLAKKPEVVRAFTKATMKGNDYALANPAEAVSILVAAVPELKTELESKKWEVTIPASTTEATRKDGIGALDRNKWAFLNELLKTYGVIDAKVDLDSVLKDGYR
jgi:NitT/TauT family transport system substrate-binding protein